MPRTCTICKHPQRLQIEKALVIGTSVRDISGQYGPSKTAISRHRTHVKETIARSADAQESVRTGALLDDVRAGERRAEHLFENAEEIRIAALRNNDQRTALQAIRTGSAVLGETRGYLSLRGELTNELGRDRQPAAMAIQIICPGRTGELPRVSFGSADAIDSAPEESCVQEIGLIQR